MKSLLAAFAAITLVPSLMPSPAFAQEAEAGAIVSAPLETRAGDVVRVLGGEMPYAAVFSEGFRAQVPEAQFQTITTQLEAQFGALIGLEDVAAASSTGGVIRIRFERGMATATLNIEGGSPHLVNGLLLTGVEPLNDSIEALVADVAALPGQSNLLVMQLGADTPIAAHNAATPLALGSAFKLYVLSALAQAVDAGELEWDDTIALNTRSYPSGMMQDWPEGAPVTLHTLATLMISISDNTATDQLIAVLGREAVEAEVAASGHADPAQMRPMLTTRELFLLKSEPGFDGAAYLALSEEQRRGRLAALAGAEREDAEILGAFSSGPNNIEVEWFASPMDLAALFTRMTALEDDNAFGVMGVNPAVGETIAERWDYVGYKGGSEPGVLNLTWLLRNAAGEWFIVSLGWNNPDAEVDLSTLNLLGMRAIALAD
ncbi:serine hydrolase [Erythrobacter sp. EC-HK427]|uniref:serine hydrolase n=1 Tax=Erythrobacter sp. EC-HK427 TaxID=2038396 RepID=UPI00125ED179|nr:serine hydrolase [Erythrobacter sp. EC-HK427]